LPDKPGRGGGAGASRLPRGRFRLAGRVVASASERQAHAEAGGIRRPQREPEAKCSGWPRPARHVDIAG